MEAHIDAITEVISTLVINADDNNNNQDGQDTDQGDTMEASSGPSCARVSITYDFKDSPTMNKLHASFPKEAEVKTPEEGMFFQKFKNSYTISFEGNDTALEIVGGGGVSEIMKRIKDRSMDEEMVALRAFATQCNMEYLTRFIQIIEKSQADDEEEFEDDNGGKEEQTQENEECDL